jgi:YaiO family outer membrane protein
VLNCTARGGRLRHIAGVSVARTGTLVGAMLLLFVFAAAPLVAQTDVVTRARGLAVAGQRGEAIKLLEESLTLSPGNSDLRVLLGTVLSWEERYDEAREKLDAVLTDSPTHGDALPASINVELWSGHPDRAEALARRGLRQRPTDASYLLARVRALVALKRSTEARDVLERLLAIEPRNEPALELRSALNARLRLWQVRVGGSYETFSDRRVAWRDAQASVSRMTPVGSVIVTGARAERFGLTDSQFELEIYPRLRPGTYAYVAGAYSPDARLYPEYRYAADLYQSLGAGFEGSAGFRRLGFARTVNIYVGSLSKYYGPWLFTGRLFATPNSDAASRSVHASVRRYFGEGGSHVGFRYGRGAWRDELLTVNDLEVLESDTGTVDATILLGGRLELMLTGSYSREDRVEQRNLRQYSLSTGLGFRF